MVPSRTSVLSSFPGLLVVLLLGLGCPKEIEDTSSPPEADADSDADADTDTDTDTDTGPVDADGDGVPAYEDCDDENPSVYPGADEYCNGVDDDCDGDVDEDAVDAGTWHRDSDGDGYGDEVDSGMVSCEQPSGHTADNTDCDDADGSIHPGADEYCDGVDTDCDGTLDENDALDVFAWYPDSDGDGYGDTAGTPVSSCDAGSGYSSETTDCDDTDPSVHPTANDVCNDGIDQDCTGSDKLCKYTGISSAADADVQILNTLEGSQLDIAVPIDDINGDGIDDLALGDPYGVGSQIGRVYLFLGPLIAGTYTVDDADVLLEGEEAITFTGDMIHSAGDNDGDGLADLLVSAPYHHDGADYAGKVYLLLGTSDVSSLSLESAHATFIGEDEGDHVGRSVTSGDVDADGLNDMVIGARYNDGGGADSGAAYLFWGGVSEGSWDCASADAIMVGAAGDEVSLVSIGDVYGDGFGDVLVGADESSAAYTSGGAVYVYSGEDLASSTEPGSPSPSTTLTAEGAWCHFGNGLQADADVNGDGVDDVLVVDSYYPARMNPPGALYYFQGPLDTGTYSAATADVRVVGDSSIYYAVHWVAAGNVNGDIFSDVIIGSMNDARASNNHGSASIFHGPISMSLTSLHESDAVFLGEAANDHFGDFVAAGGDTNGDGYDDIAVVAWNSYEGADRAGKAYVFFGGVP